MAWTSGSEHLLAVAVSQWIHPVNTGQDSSSVNVPEYEDVNQEQLVANHELVKPHSFRERKGRTNESNLEGLAGKG